MVIGILNALGEPVRNVLSERQTPGVYQATINMTGLEAGAYFYSLAIGGKCVVRPFLVMK